MVLAAMLADPVSAAAEPIRPMRTNTAGVPNRARRAMATRTTARDGPTEATMPARKDSLTSFNGISTCGAAFFAAREYKTHCTKMTAKTPRAQIQRNGELARAQITVELGSPAAMMIWGFMCAPMAEMNDCEVGLFHVQRSVITLSLTRYGLIRQISGQILQMDR